MRFLLLALLPLLAACGSSPAPYIAPPLPPAAVPAVVDPSGVRSALLPSRDVVLEDISIVGRWEAVSVVDDPDATEDLQTGILAKTLIINPTGQAILRGWDQREAGGQEASFSGQITGASLRIGELPGAATLYLSDDHLLVTDPSGTTTVYDWRGR
ncbi:MAG: hypothetical protein AAGI52_05310 [Bacteroidota bacterium]